MWIMVRPVFKKGSRGRATHYRSISIPCVACKIMESIERNAIYDLLVVNSLLCPAQHGFRTKRSTVSSLLLIHNDKVNYVEDNSDVDVKLFDFAKAFDVVEYNLLLLKLNTYGCSKYTFLWLADFLRDKKQFVCIDGNVSAVCSVPSGVIQDSVIGSLLFMLFINNLPDVTKFAFILLYADDHKLLCGVKSIADRKLLQNDINAVYLWSISWRSRLSLDKLMYFHVGCRLDNHDFTCGPHVIKLSVSVKDLGVMLSNNMSF